MDKYRHQNANRGHDKVSLFNKYQQNWSGSKFINSNHKAGYMSNESREGRKGQEKIE